MKVPSSRLIGVCTNQVMIMTANVSQSACQVPGSVNAWTQLWPPTNLMAPIPSQSVNESTRTPINGMKANARNMSKAGSTRMPSRLFVAPVGALDSSTWVSPGWTRGASAAMSLLDGGVHGGRELLGRDLQQEQLVDVVHQGLGLRRAERLVPRLLEVGRLSGRVVDELQERGIGRTGQLRLCRLYYRDLAALDVRVELGIGEQPVGEVGLGNRLLRIGGLGRDGEIVRRVTDGVLRVSLAAGHGREVPPSEPAGNKLRLSGLHGPVRPAAVQHHRCLAGVQHRLVGICVGGDRGEPLDEAVRLHEFLDLLAAADHRRVGP